jgi:hypothetical protein
MDLCQEMPRRRDPDALWRKRNADSGGLLDEAYDFVCDDDQAARAKLAKFSNPPPVPPSARHVGLTGVPGPGRHGYAGLDAPAPGRPSASPLPGGGQAGHPPASSEAPAEVFVRRHRHGHDDREDGVVKLSLDVLRPMFETRLTDAAQELGLSVSALQHACRRLGVERWPWRGNYFCKKSERPGRLGSRRGTTSSHRPASGTASGAGGSVATSGGF